MTIETTPERTLQLLQKAVEERGEDFVYPDEWKGGTEDNVYPSTCRYVLRGDSKPACIAGYVFHAYGMPLQELSQHEGKSAWKLAEEVDVDSASSAMINAAQVAQDDGKSWGSALAAAVLEYEFAQTIEDV